LKGGFHIAYLGKPLRFWRMNHAASDLLGVSRLLLRRGFIVIGFIQLLISFYSRLSLELFFENSYRCLRFL